MERGPLRKGKTVKQKKRKLPVLLRSLIVLTSAFLALSVTCVITVNWLDLKSRENNTAPSLFDWYFASLPESVTEEKLHAGDLLLAKKAEGYTEGALVLCRNVPGAEIVADGRFALARVVSHEQTEYTLRVCTDGREISTVQDQEEIIGEVSFAIGILGTVVDFVRKPVGFFSLILGSAGALLILILISAIVTYRRNMQELAEAEAAEQTTIESFELEQPASPLLNHEVKITPEQVTLAMSDDPADKKPLPEKAVPPAAAPAKPSQEAEPEPEVKAAQKPAGSPAVLERPVSPAVLEPAVRKAVSASPAEPVRVETSPVQALSNAHVPQEKKSADKPPFSDLITDEIIEQFRRELEAVRLRPLEPEKKEKES